MHRRIILVGALLALSLHPAAALASDSDLYQPPASTAPSKPQPAKPQPSKPKRAPLAGVWTTVTRGSTACNFGTGTITVGSDGKSGHADVGRWPGELHGVTVKGNAVHIAYDYTDSFGGAALATYDGTIDGDTITGVIGGTWTGKCSFVMTRQ